MHAAVDESKNYSAVPAPALVKVANLTNMEEAPPLGSAVSFSYKGADVIGTVLKRQGMRLRIKHDSGTCWMALSDVRAALENPVTDSGDVPLHSSVAQEDSAAAMPGTPATVVSSSVAAASVVTNSASRVIEERCRAMCAQQLAEKDAQIAEKDLVIAQLRAENEALSKRVLAGSARRSTFWMPEASAGSARAGAAAGGTAYQGSVGVKAVERGGSRVGVELIGFAPASPFLPT